MGWVIPLARQHVFLVALTCFLCDFLLMSLGVFVVGGLAAKLLLTEKLFFIAGALVASCTWFFGLAYATRHLLGWLKTPKAGRYFDYFMALVMWALALQLAYFFYQGNLF
jgi:arginine exporter protein ArgO